MEEKIYKTAIESILFTMGDTPENSRGVGIRYRPDEMPNRGTGAGVRRIWTRDADYRAGGRLPDVYGARRL